MPFVTKMFDWRDREFRRADEVFVAVVAVLTIAMLVGYVVYWF